MLYRLSLQGAHYDRILSLNSQRNFPSAAASLSMNNRKGQLKASKQAKNSEENNMVEEQMNVEHISLHGYIRNTASDTEVHAEHPLRADRNNT